jgi:hypothetical protein
MDLELVEPHPRRVLEAFRRGEFDGLEVLGQADEQAFFELGFREKLLDALAAAMPTARQKEEVPRGVVLMAKPELEAARRARLPRPGAGGALWGLVERFGSGDRFQASGSPKSGGGAPVCRLQ